MKKSQLIAILVAIIAIIFFALLGSLVESVDAKEYHIKQAFMTGTISVHGEPGAYMQMLGTVEPYPRTITFYFSNADLDGGNDEAAKALSATFMGNSTADVSGMLMVEMPLDSASRVDLHRKYGSVQAIRMDLLRNAIEGALKQTGPMFRPEGAFTTRRPEFTRIMRDILIDGIPETEIVVDTLRENDKEIYMQRSIIKRGAKIRVGSSLTKYNIKVSDFVIKDMDFDNDTDKLIKAKKVSQQKIITARSDADKAKQDAITAREQGKAKIATAEANALVEKKTAIVNAEKEAAVAKQNKLKAIENAAATLATKTAEAQGAKLKVAAGLTPQERASFKMKTEIGKAQAIAAWVGPKIVMMNGSGSGGNSNPMLNALGIKAMMDINSKMSD